MKGLVFKDLLLMKKMNKKVIFVMYFFVIAISFFGENEVYSIMSSAFFSLFIGMHFNDDHDLWWIDFMETIWINLADE